MASESGSSPIPIYVSFSTFGTLLDWLKEMRVIPSQLDSSLWRSKFNGAVGSQLMGGLRFLKLLDGDSPAERLEALALADPDKRKVLLLDIFRDAYGTDVIDGLPRMSPRMLDDKFVALGTTDSTHRKAISFFINAAKWLELSVPGPIAKKARNRPATRGPKRNGGKPTTPTKPAGDEVPGNGTSKGNQRQNGGSGIEHPVQQGDSMTISLPDDVLVTLSINKSALKVKGADRAFILRLIEQMEKYEADLVESSTGATVPDSGN